MLSFKVQLISDVPAEWEELFYFKIARFHFTDEAYLADIVTTNYYHLKVKVQQCSNLFSFKPE